MTRRRVADDQYGKLQRRLDEVARRVDEGPLDFQETMLRLQRVTENCLPESYQLFSSVRWKEEELIDLGDYDHVAKVVERLKFPFVSMTDLPYDISRFRVEFLQFEDSVGSDEILTTAERKGLKRLPPVCALLFGICYPTLQRYYDLHFIHDPLFDVSAEDLGKVAHRSPSGAAFTADLPGKRYLVLDGEVNDGGRRGITVSPLYETGQYGGNGQMFGFRRDLPR